MNLINKTIKSNENTFAPELEVTIRLPIDFIQNTNPDYETIGKELMQIIVQE